MCELGYINEYAEDIIQGEVVIVYGFKNNFMRSACYQTLTYDVRKKLHRKYASLKSIDLFEISGNESENEELNERTRRLNKLNLKRHWLYSRSLSYEEDSKNEQSEQNERVINSLVSYDLMQELSKQKGKNYTLYKGNLYKKNDMGNSFVNRYLEIDSENLY